MKFVVVSCCAAPAVSDAAVPEQFVKTPEAGVPNAGVTKVGLSANTRAPEPVSSVTADFRLAEDGVAKNVATPVPNPEIPEATGKPVQFVSVPDAGVPNAGVTNVGDVKVPVVTVGLATDGEIKCVFCCATFVPSDQTVIVLPAGMTTVVPPLNVMPLGAVELEMVAV